MLHLLSCVLNVFRQRDEESARRGSLEDSHREPGNEADGVSRYPAFLHAEKPMGDVSEYTHVWEVHPPMICQDSGHVPHVHTCKMAEREAAKRGSKEGIYSRSTEGIYDSQVSTDDKPIFISRNMPLYFDMENTIPRGTCRRPTVT